MPQLSWPPPPPQAAAHPQHPQMQPHGHALPPYGAHEPHAPHGAYPAEHGHPFAQPAPQGHPQHWPHASEPTLPDPRAFDFNDYSAAQAAATGRAPQPGYPPLPLTADPHGGHDPFRHAAAPQWPSPPQPGAYADARAAYPHPDAASGHLPPGWPSQPPAAHLHVPPHAPAPGHALPPLAYDAGVHGQHPGQPADEPAEEDEYEEEEYEDEAPRGGSKLMVVGALVGAICLGGGLAYAYKTFSGGGSGKTPLIKADNTPVKARPATPPAPSGGKVAERAPDAPPTQAVAAATDTTEGGTRRVPIIPITPGAPSAVAPAAPPPPPQVSTGIPGMVLDNTGPRALPPVVPISPPTATAAPRPTPPATAPSPTPPALKVVQPPAAPTPPPAKVASAAPAAAPAVEAAKKPVPKQKTADAYSPTTATGGGVATAAVAPAPAKSALGAGGNGFVAAILSTQKGRPDAMRAFADLQQKYPDVLGGKPAEVQEKDLGDKGVWYRAVVGPPGSREAAVAVCTQLRAAGHNGCFATPY